MLKGSTNVRVFLYKKAAVCRMNPSGRVHCYGEISGIMEKQHVSCQGRQAGILTSLLTAWVRTGGHKTPEQLIALMTGYLEEAMRGDILL